MREALKPIVPADDFGARDLSLEEGPEDVRRLERQLEDVGLMPDL